MWPDTGNVLGVIGGLITSFGGVPQIYKIVKTHKTKDLSWYMLASWLTGLSLTLSYGIMSRQYPVIINACVSLSLSSTIASLKFYYEQRRAGECEEGTPLESNGYC